MLDSGEVIPIPCGRNSCPHCRRRNVQVTAALMGLNQTRTERPVTHAVLSTTRDWAGEDVLRAGWKEMARLVRRDVCGDARYAWFREWTEGKNDGVRRTHFHSTWALDDDDQAQAVAEISRQVWRSRTGAHSEKAHGWQRVYDAGGLARYVAGLVGHHLKESQAPPPGWSGRRYGVSRGFYSGERDQLLREAQAAVRDDRLVHHLTMAAFDAAGVSELPAEIVDDYVTGLLDQLRDRPPPRIRRIRPGFWA